MTQFFTTNAETTNESDLVAACAAPVSASSTPAAMEVETELRIRNLAF
jgi:hypothetical protein